MFLSPAILIIKFAALGDFALALGAMQAIRRHHPQQKLILLTTKPFAELARQSGWFDDIWEIKRPRQWNLWAWWRLAQKIHREKFARIYDLQRSKGTARIFSLLPAPKPEWNGITEGCSHPHRDELQHLIHTIDRHRSQLAEAGITDVLQSDLSWVIAATARFNLPQSYGLLVPGASPRRPAKRWPAVNYAAIANQMAARGITPVILGGLEEKETARTILNHAPQAISLVGKTSFADIVALARQARFALGNDTGPMHLISPTGCRTLTLFGGDSDPALTEPRGPQAETLSVPHLDGLPVADIGDRIKGW
jgi:ADP-heptose:LPS heptosyltransferase